MTSTSPKLPPTLTRNQPILPNYGLFSVNTLRCTVHVLSTCPLQNANLLPTSHLQNIEYNLQSVIYKTLIILIVSFTRDPITFNTDIICKTSICLQRVIYEGLVSFQLLIDNSRQLQLPITVNGAIFINT